MSDKKIKLAKKNLAAEVEQHISDASSLNELFMNTEPVELDAELAEFLKSNPVFGQVLRHPLVFSIPYHPQLNRFYNKQLAEKRARVNMAIAENDWAQVLFWYERPYRLKYFIYYMDKFKAGEFSRLLNWVYTDSECPSVNLTTFIMLFDLAKEKAHPSLFSRKDYREFIKFDDELTIYRGCHKKESGRRSLVGLSWTLDRDKAAWFATRYRSRQSTGVVMQAEVSKWDVYFYDNGRAEQEIVVNPKYLRNIKIIP